MVSFTRQAHKRVTAWPGRPWKMWTTAYYLLCLFHLKMSNHYTKITARGKEKKSPLARKTSGFQPILTSTIYAWKASVKISIYSLCSFANTASEEQYFPSLTPTGCLAISSRKARACLLSNML